MSLQKEVIVLDATTDLLKDPIRLLLIFYTFLAAYDNYFDDKITYKTEFVKMIDNMQNFMIEQEEKQTPSESDLPHNLSQQSPSNDNKTDSKIRVQKFTYNQLAAMMEIVRNIYIGLIYTSLGANLFGLFLLLRPKADYKNDNSKLFLNSALAAVITEILVYLVFVGLFTFSAWQLKLFYVSASMDVFSYFMIPALDQFLDKFIFGIVPPIANYAYVRVLY
ncbi:UNKNOWN [Stylonychia lemnae]|uniref:Uncharacterized protein n=1 Tax=Stylonychia lemnae TaxID=5949 RepID=A0A078ACG9_STYLE|nr:UNKNOWN [Stylonychia lemnae]|eukprot:CDW78528.1 UNKNOWN [Stylonychia lemnae]